MVKDRDRDSDGSLPGQSNRPALTQHDSDSQGSDHAHHPGLNAQHQRAKPQKHIVGGGTGGRLHARVPSSKALHKHAGPSSSTAKLSHRRHASPSPERSELPSAHRRSASEVKLSRDPSSTNLKKNASQTSLKRNRSQADVLKKNRSSTQLKRTSSNTHVHKSNKTQVHFDLGNDGVEDEWVDASTDPSPLISRRESVISSGHSSSKPPASASSSQPQSPRSPRQPAHVEHNDLVSNRFEAQNGGPRPGSSQSHQIKHSLTNRLLQRTSSYGAPPKMSAATASVQPPSSRQHSPDSGRSRESTSTLSGEPGSTVAHGPSSSGGKEGLTSRFVTTSSHGSASGFAGNGSFYARSPKDGLAHATTATRTQAVVGSNPLPRRPKSLASLGQPQHEPHESQRHRTHMRNGHMSDVDDDEDPGVLASKMRSRRSGGSNVPRSDMTRTQQKINLQRASSSLEPQRHYPGMGMGIAGLAVAAGPLVGGSGYEDRDPRVGKLLEKAGMEYLVVRRYQNPVARSIARLSQLPGLDKGRRIPGAGRRAGANGHSKRTSEHGGSSRDSLRDGHGEGGVAAALMHAQGASRTGGPSTPRRNYSSIRTNGTGSSLDTDDGHRMHHHEEAHHHQRLSGASLVGNDEDAETLALLRSLWDKNLDLSASQD